MTLADMKRTKADKKAETKRWDEPIGAGDYPYGLAIDLDDETITKLGLGDVDADDKVKIAATAFVSSSNTNKRNGKTTRSVTLQITTMAVIQGESKEATASAMYDDK